MTITLSAEQERLVAEAVASGEFSNAEEVIAQALEMLRADWLREDRDAIEAKIERAFREFEQGAFFSAEASRADMEQRKAAWRRDQSR